MLKNNKIFSDPEILFEFSEFFYLLTKHHLQYDHHFSALNSFITSQYLLYMAKECISECKQDIRVPVLPKEFVEMLRNVAI